MENNDHPIVTETKAGIAINQPNNPDGNTGFSPIQYNTTPAAIRALGGKSFEEKIYLVLYNRTDEDSNGFLLCTGRMECYTAIDRLLHTYPIDIHNSAVLVEIPAVNKSGKGEWVLKHIDKAPSIYQFCKSVENMFPGIEFSIDDYNDEPVEDESKQEEIAVNENDLRAMMPQVTVAERYSEAIEYEPVTDAYRELLKERLQSEQENGV